MYEKSLIIYNNNNNKIVLNNPSKEFFMKQILGIFLTALSLQAATITFNVNYQNSSMKNDQEGLGVNSVYWGAATKIVSNNDTIIILGSTKTLFTAPKCFTHSKKITVQTPFTGTFNIVKTNFDYSINSIQINNLINDTIINITASPKLIALTGKILNKNGQIVVNEKLYIINIVFSNYPKKEYVMENGQYVEKINYYGKFDTIIDSSVSTNSQGTYSINTVFEGNASIIALSSYFKKYRFYNDFVRKHFNNEFNNDSNLIFIDIFNNRGIYFKYNFVNTYNFIKENCTSIKGKTICNNLPIKATLTAFYQSYEHSMTDVTASCTLTTTSDSLGNFSFITPSYACSLIIIASSINYTFNSTFKSKPKALYFNTMSNDTFFFHYHPDTNIIFVGIKNPITIPELTTSIDTIKTNNTIGYTYPVAKVNNSLSNRIKFTTIKMPDWLELVTSNTRDNDKITKLVGIKNTNKKRDTVQLSLDLDNKPIDTFNLDIVIPNTSIINNKINFTNNQISIIHIYDMKGRLLSSCKPIDLLHTLKSLPASMIITKSITKTNNIITKNIIN